MTKQLQNNSLTLSILNLLSCKFNLLSCKFYLLVPLLACLGAIICRQRPQSGFQPDLSKESRSTCDATPILSEYLVCQIPIWYEFRTEEQIMSLHFVIVHLLLVVFFCVQLCSFCFVVNDSLFWLLKGRKFTTVRPPPYAVHVDVFFFF